MSRRRTRPDRAQSSIERAQYGRVALARAALAAERFHVGTRGQDVTRLYGARAGSTGSSLPIPQAQPFPTRSRVRQPSRLAAFVITVIVITPRRQDATAGAAS
jgi:hypothetical protein